MNSKRTARNSQGWRNAAATRRAQVFVNRLNASPRQWCAGFLRQLIRITRDQPWLARGQTLDPSWLLPQRQELRELVDLYLDTGDVAAVTERLKIRLSGMPYQLVPEPLKREGRGAVEQGAVVQLRYEPYGETETLHPQDWRDFTELLASPLAQRLRQCPECRRYFLALKRQDKKCCSPRCSRRAADHYEKEHHPEAYRLRKREEARRRRQRKKQQTT